MSGVSIFVSNGKWHDINVILSISNATKNFVLPNDLIKRGSILIICLFVLFISCDFIKLL